MKNDNFKNQVQEELDGLWFEPSDKVWPGVRRQLEKEKQKRRIIFFWVLLGCLLLSGGLITYFNSSLKNKEIAATTIKSENKTQNITVENILTESNDTVTAYYKVADSFLQKQMLASRKTNDTNSIATQKLIKIKSKTAIVVKVPGLVKDVSGKNKITTVSSNPVSQEDDIAVTEKNIEVPENNFTKTASADTNDIAVVVNNPDTINKKIRDTAIVKSKPAIPKKKQKHPWLFGIEMGLGVSNIGNGFTLGIDGNSKKSLFDNAAYTTGPPSQAVLANAPSVFKKGAAFNAGFIAERKIGKHFSLVTGINYKYLSAGILTGQGFDTVINSLQDRSTAYRQGSVKSYLNKFHFIGIPVSAKINLFAKNNFSTDVNMGINIMQLLTVNALLYDSSVRFYYYNKSVFNKTQLAFGAGVQLNYRLNNNFLIAAGPQFIHSITETGKGYNYSDKYFKIWAVKAKILFNKKNMMQR